MRIDLHVHHHFDTPESRAELLQGIQAIVTNSEKKVMAKVEDGLAQVNTQLDTLATGLTGIAGDLASLKAQLGQMTPEQETAMNAVIERVTALASQATAIDAETPPAP